MEFLKKHYEKILLGLVLAGLVGALVSLPFYISADDQKLIDIRNSVLEGHPQKLPDLDLTAQERAVSRLQTAFSLDLDTSNKLFNPMEWQKAMDGSLIRSSHVGPQVATVTAITPLYLVLSLDSIATNELGARYVIGVEKQGEKSPAKRHPQTRYISQGDKPNDIFGLVSVQGAPENPDSLVLKLQDTGELATISRDKAFRRVDAYATDFRYDPEKKSFRARRAGDKVSFGGTDYIITDVSQNGLILSDQSNQKKTSLPFTP